MFKNAPLLVRLLCIFVLLPFLRLTQATPLKTNQAFIDRRWTHPPVCEFRTFDSPQNPRAFSEDCRLLIQEHITSGPGPLGSRLSTGVVQLGGSTAWKEEVLPNSLISGVPPHSIWSTSRGDCGISFGVHRPMGPSTWPIVQEALKSIAETCVYGKGQGGKLVEGGVQVFISTQYVNRVRQAGLGFGLGRMDTSNRRPGLRHPELLPQDPRAELRRRGHEGASMEGLAPQPGSLASSGVAPAGASRTSAAGAELRAHPEHPRRQSQAEKNRICALVDRFNPETLTPAQQAKVKLCCKLGVGVCSFAAGVMVGGVIDQKLLVPLVALGSVSGLGLAALPNVREWRSAGSFTSSLRHPLHRRGRPCPQSNATSLSPPAHRLRRNRPPAPAASTSKAKRNTAAGALSCPIRSSRTFKGNI